jgi:hydrogenase maturation protein HypF
MRGEQLHLGGTAQEESAVALVPDAATCPACLAEVRDPLARRFRYPFTSCAECGPRHSLGGAASLPLCAECAAERADASGRRHRAPALACFQCGPGVRLERSDGRAFSYERFTALDPVDAVGGLLLQGEIVAVKGPGGYQLFCDATRAEVVARLRQRQQRAQRPLALMARDLAVLGRYARVSPDEAAALGSAAAPIVLLEPLPGGEQVAPGVSQGSSTLGFCLPPTPLHHLMLRRLDRAVVCTGGNRPGEPRSLDDAGARERLGSIADWLLHHDRPLLRPLEESVRRTSAGSVRSLRRARGEAPRPLLLPRGFERAQPLLAAGAGSGGALCLGWSGRAVLSPQPGVLDERQAGRAWDEAAEELHLLTGQRPRAIAVDLHPGHASTQAAARLAAAGGASLVPVQQHHAHLAACLLENGRPLGAPPVLGVVMGGVLWGGEFLLGSYARAERFAALKPVPLLGGEAASLAPWRSLYAHLMAELGWAELSMNFSGLPLVRRLAERPRALLEQERRDPARSPPASSCGRLFDAVAAALGLAFEEAADEGQAAALLEACVDAPALREASATERYPLSLPLLEGKGLRYVEPLGMWRALLGDLFEGARPALISARFHLALATAIARVAQKARDLHEGLTTVALSGGCFQNRLLTELCAQELALQGFEVLLHREVPPGSGCVALGQVAVAMARQLGREG